MSERGALRREQLETAGVDLLAEGGWPAVTTRAVAERSGANAGLIHYHYGGLPGLRLTIAARVARASIQSVVGALTSADDVEAAVLRCIRAAGDDEEMRRLRRLTSELVAAALRDDGIRELVRDELRVARSALGEWVSRLQPDWSQQQVNGVVILITAFLDGLFLQHLVDPDLDLSAAATGFAQRSSTTASRKRDPLHRRAVAAWVERYERAWRAPDEALGDELAGLFGADVTYRTAPFEEPYRGRDAIAEMWRTQRQAPSEVFTMAGEVVAVDEDAAVVRVEVRYDRPTRQVYRDLWVLRFDADGRCSVFEEWPFWPAGSGGEYAPGPSPSR